ncbi:hypothetical protein SAMN05421736_101165 [Evansella caseinilytica]|uniref:Uncharacterized protein n=1 Tax=Evansella caseinilytica TaxID=1503961 RepID=A0A1H3GGK0_9BACI|nr:hypothetical protein [Evansella caseinilytica]SDY02433.1 hypothetical protein SAMN05421736_101165 [Evansella caseinilytica]
MITAKSDMIDKILGMKIGDDDDITKPFEMRIVGDMVPDNFVNNLFLLFNNCLDTTFIR